MSGWTAMAGTHDFQVADEGEARRLVEALAGHGFPDVAAWPSRVGGGWRVSALDEGPYPPDVGGRRQFAAVRRAAARIARDHGGYPAGGGQFDVSMLSVVRARPNGSVRATNPGARPPMPEVNVAESPPTGELPFGPDRRALVRPDLSGLDTILWARLSHAHGTAADIPHLIRALARDEDWNETNSELIGDNLLHQGSCYSATAPAIPFLVELIGSLDVRRRLYLGLDLVFAARQWGDSLVNDAVVALVEQRMPRALPWTAEVNAAVGESLPRLLAQWDDEVPAVQFVLAGLAGLFPHHGQAMTERVATMAEDLIGTAQGACLDLALSLIRGRDEETMRTVADIAAWLDEASNLDIESIAETVTAAVVGGRVLADATMRCTPDPNP